MAAFGYKQDADLPLLTRVYQVDSLSADELTDLLRKWAAMQRSFTFPDDALTVAPRDARDEDSNRLGFACRLAQRAMRTMRYEGYIETGDLMDVVGLEVPGSVNASPEELAMQEFVRGLRGRSEKLTFGRIGERTEAQRAAHYARPVKMLTLAIFSDLYALVVAFFRLAHEKYLEAGAAGRHPELAGFSSLLPECPVCGNLFIPRRTGQEFCSHRCRHTDGMRRRRRELSEGRP